MGLKTAVAVHQLKLHLFSFLDRLETIHDKLRIMEENVAAIMKPDEAVPFLLIEFSDFSLRHAVSDPSFYALTTLRA